LALSTDSFGARALSVLRIRIYFTSSLGSLAMAEGRAPTLDDRMLRAVGHPLRFRVLVTLDEGVASPNQIAQKLGEPLGRVAHHVRLLAQLGAIELVSTRPRRGATEHFYRAVTRPWFDDGAWAKLPLSTRRTLVGDLLRRIAADVSASVEGGGFDHLLTYVSRTYLELDEAGMVEVSHILDETVERVLAVQDEAKARVGAGGEASRTELVALHFGR
jgi:DNA-binding transcriptional ArsR family regulator